MSTSSSYDWIHGWDRSRLIWIIEKRNAKARIGHQGTLDLIKKRREGMEPFFYLGNSFWKMKIDESNKMFSNWGNFQTISTWKTTSIASSLSNTFPKKWGGNWSEVKNPCYVWRHLCFSWFLIFYKENILLFFNENSLFVDDLYLIILIGKRNNNRWQ